VWHKSCWGATLLSAGPEAGAACVDNDGDEYYTGTDTGCVALDCNDGDSLVNPDQAEDLATAHDDDCDGLEVIYQMMEAPLGNGAWWNTTNVTFAGNLAILAPSGGSPATMELKSSFDWEYGELHARVGVADVDGPTTCTVTVDAGADGTDTDSFTAEGEHDLSFPDLDAPFTVDSFEISCSHVGPPPTIDIDYVNILNGDFLWQPPRDQEIAYIDADWPLGGNVASVVRTDETGNNLVAASNNGGVALSTDGSGDVWWLINGEIDGQKLDTQDKLRTWEVFAQDEDDIVVLTGTEISSTMYGGLYRTTNSGLGWYELTDVEARADDRFHICTDKSLAGGKLMTGWIDGDSEQVLFFGNHDTSLGTSKHVGVYGLTSEDTCSIEWVADLPATGIVSAMEVTTVGDDDVLIVGFKTIDEASAEPDTLYYCPISGKCGGAPALDVSCLPIAGSEGWDVRDIAVQVVDEDVTLIYAADAGLGLDTAVSSACSREEGTVQVVELDASGGSVAVSTWDSDTTTSGTCEAGDFSGCPQAWHDPSDTGLLHEDYRQYYDSTYGKDLGAGEMRLYTTSTVDSVNELTGVALFDDGAQQLLFAIANLSQAYAFPRIYRADVGTDVPEPNDTLPWKPLQDYYTGESVVLDTDDTSADTNPEQRGEAGNDKGTYLRALANHDDRAEVFPDRPVDITFYELPGEDDWEGQVYGFLGIWELPNASGGAPGFDSAYGNPSVDLDKIPFGFSPLSGLGDFQQTTTQDVAFCEGCAVSGINAEGMAFGAVADHGIANYFGPPSSGAREAGNLECHFANFTEVRNLDLVEDDTTATLWGVYLHAGGDPPSKRAISKAVITLADEDDVEDWNWCYETSTSGKTAAPETYVEQAGEHDWVCKRHEADTTYPRWPACDSSTDGELLDIAATELGNPFDIEALHDDADVALATFYSHASGDTADPYDREGGLVLFYDDSGEMTRDRVPFTMTGTGCTSLDENEFFDGAVTLAIDQASSAWSATASERDVWAYVGGSGTATDDCSIFQVHITYDSGIEAEWTELPIGSGTDCSGLGGNKLQGIAAAPWASDRIWAFGEAEGSDSLCQIDALDADNPVLDPMAPDGTTWRRIKHVSPHPYLVDTLLVGVGVQAEDKGGVTWETLDLFQASWRWFGAAGEVKASWRPYRDSGLYNGNITGVAFDVDESSTPYDVTSIWISTAGNGVWEGSRGWRF